MLAAAGREATSGRAIDLLPQKLVARMTERRGQPYAFPRLRPDTTALVVIDMVQLFLRGRTGVADLVANINRAAGQIRASGGPVLWVRPGLPRDHDLMDAVLGAAQARRYRDAALDEDANGFHLALAIDAGDLQVHKSLYSAFFPGACPGIQALRERGIDGVLIAGALTDVCVEASARDAYSAGFKTVLLADGCIGSSEAAHRDALAAVYRNFGDVRNVSELGDVLIRSSVEGSGGIP